MQIRDHTILFTEACPLNCKYCYIQTDPIYGSAKQVTLADIIAFIEKIKSKEFRGQSDARRAISKSMIDGKLNNEEHVELRLLLIEEYKD